MSGDDSRSPSELQDLASEVADAAAAPTAGYHLERRVVEPTAPRAPHADPDHSRRSARAFWNVTWISAAAIIIALAMIAATGWLF